MNIMDYELLHNACIDGDLTEVKRLVRLGMNVNVEDDNRRTPLHVASMNGHLDIVKFLVRNGANVNKKDDEGYTPLHYACYETVYGDNVSIVRFLIKNGAKVNKKNNVNTTPLHYACYGGDFDIVKLLVDNGANVNIQNNEGSPLQYACEHGYFDIVKYLVDNGADVNIRNSKGQNLIDVINIEDKYNGISERNVPEYKKIIVYLFNNGFKIPENWKYNNYSPFIVELINDIKKKIANKRLSILKTSIHLGTLYNRSKERYYDPDNPYGYMNTVLLEKEKLMKGKGNNIGIRNKRIIPKKRKVGKKT